MNLFKPRILVLFAATALISGIAIVAQTSVADSGDKITATSSLKTPIVNRAITESEVLAAQKAWGKLWWLFPQPMMRKVKHQLKL